MTTKKLCFTALGIALYVVLALCLQVPVFENYYLCLGYIAMAVYCWYFGPFSAAAVGGLGVVLYCVLINGLRGMPGWALGNVVIALALGFACSLTKGISRTWLRLTVLAVVIVVGCAVGILGVKSFVEYVLYAQPMAVRVAKNVFAFVADVVVLWAGLLLCPAFAPLLKKLLPEKN